jgi:hypothetical protein
MCEWKTDDKKWLKARKEVWRPIKKSLREIDELDRDYLKRLQEYFLTGKEPKIRHRHKPYILMIFRLWFHVDQSEGNWSDIIRETGVDDFRHSRGIYLRHAGRAQLFVDDYGFMGGLEERFVKVFYPVTDAANETIEVDGENIRIFQNGFENFIKKWLSEIGLWLIESRSNPYCIYQYMLDFILDNYHISKLSKLKDDPDDENIPALLVILAQCAHFIEPKEMPGEDSSQRRFAQKIYDELEQRELLPYLSELWEKMKTSKGRNADTVEREEEYAYDFEEDDDGKKELDDEGYITLVIHDTSLHPELFEKFATIYNELGFSEFDFFSSQVEAIDLSEHLTAGMVKRLGYKKGGKVPGYRYRIDTNNNYTDSDIIKINVDLVMPVPHSSHKFKKDTPVFMIVPRPNSNYYIECNIAYELNVRMMVRVFMSKVKLEPVRYVMSDYGLLYDEIEPHYYEIKDQPFINDRRAFEDKAEYDFPKWKGKPLPELDL